MWSEQVALLGFDQDLVCSAQLTDLTKPGVYFHSQIYRIFGVNVHDMLPINASCSSAPGRSRISSYLSLEPLLLTNEHLRVPQPRTPRPLNILFHPRSLCFYGMTALTQQRHGLLQRFLPSSYTVEAGNEGEGGSGSNSWLREVALAARLDRVELGLSHDHAI